MWCFDPVKCIKWELVLRKGNQKYGHQLQLLASLHTFFLQSHVLIAASGFAQSSGSLLAIR